VAVLSAGAIATSGIKFCFFNSITHQAGAVAEALAGWDAQRNGDTGGGGGGAGVGD
jgi:hypothetical protein